MLRIAGLITKAGNGTLSALPEVLPLAAPALAPFGTADFPWAAARAGAPVTGVGTIPVLVLSLSLLDRRELSRSLLERRVDESVPSVPLRFEEPNRLDDELLKEDELFKEEELVKPGVLLRRKFAL